MKKKFIYVLPLTLMIFLTACGENEGGKIEENPSKKTEQKADKKEKKKEKIHKIGETVKVNGVQVTIDQAKIVKPDKNINPQKGKVLELKITVKNGSKNKINVHSSQFTLFKGEKPQEEYYGKKAPISGDINKDKKLSGILKYDVAKSGTYKLIYTPSFSSNQKEIKWTIDVN